MTFVELWERLTKIAEVEEGDAPWFAGRPDRWWENAHWRCTNGHVSTSYLKSEARAASVCLAGGCRQPVTLTFPEDADGPLRPTRKPAG